MCASRLEVIFMHDKFETLAEGYAKRAKVAARALRIAPASVREKAIRAIADSLEAHVPAIEAKNAADLAAGTQAGLSDAMLDRLRLDAKRIGAMAKSLREIAMQPDPLGRILEKRTRPDGLALGRISVPLGVVFFIYESRPNVTTDAAGPLPALGERHHPAWRQGSDQLQSSPGRADLEGGRIFRTPARRGPARRGNRSIAGHRAPAPGRRNRPRDSARVAKASSAP